MSVGDRHQVKHPLHRAVLTGRAVEGIEHDVGVEVEQPDADLAVHVELGHAHEAAFAKGPCNALPAHQRDWALG